MIVYTALQKLYLNAQESRKYKYDLERADVHYNRVIARKLVKGWYEVSQNSILKLEMKRVADYHWYRFKIFSSLSLWHRRLTSRIQQRTRWKLAMVHHDRQMILQHLSAWRVCKFYLII
jgi:hypothetical protein